MQRFWRVVGHRMEHLQTIYVVESEMGAETNPAPLSEPEIIPCLFISGLAVEISDSVVRLVGWVTLPALSAEGGERRVVIRCAMSNTHARHFQAALRKGLTRGGN